MLGAHRRLASQTLSLSCRRSSLFPNSFFGARGLQSLDFELATSFARPSSRSHRALMSVLEGLESLTSPLKPERPRSPLRPPEQEVIAGATYCLYHGRARRSWVLLL